MELYIYRSAIFILAFIISMILSSVSIRVGIPYIKSKTIEGTDQSKNHNHKTRLWIDIGFWIGLFETLIIFIFVANKEFAGLALIFGAKEFVRKEEIKNDPAYYLLGTMINLGISILVMEIALDIISILDLAIKEI